MKTLLSLVAAAAVFGVAAPSAVKADCHAQTRVIGYTSCGQPIVAVYRIVGYDHCGRPVGQWVPVQQPSYGYAPGYSHGHHGHGPSYSSPRNGISFSFGFRR